VGTANVYAMKQMNRTTILSLIRQYGPISKSELAEKSNLTFAAVHNIVSELLERELVRESGYGESTGAGRKPVLYEVNPHAYAAVGVHLGVTQVEVAVIDGNGAVLADSTEELQANVRPAEAFDIVAARVEEAIVRSNVPRSRLLGIGISAPGPLDPEAGMLLSPPNFLGWERVPLKAQIEEKLSLPVFVEKDANAAALAELWFGAGSGARNILYVMVDLGIGGGLIVDGRLYRGHQNVAGEFGHGTIDLDGPRCNCGNYGCLEAVASGVAIVRRAEEAIRRGAPTRLAPLYQEKEHLSFADVVQALQEDDALAHQLFLESARYIGIGLAGFINYFNPEMVIIGGRLLQVCPAMFPVIRDTAYARMFRVNEQNVRIELSGLGTKGEVVGAGTLVFERTLYTDFMVPSSNE